MCIRDSNGGVYDVAWAPNLGRSFHLIATACKDKCVRIFKVSNVGPEKLECFEIACLDKHNAAVWRVEWNVTGTILASSGDDGNVYLWKANFKGEWKELSVMNGEEDGACKKF
eukprot:TRINITY_DN2778_c0_g1_i1.p1 TRINITY_DN2778_c0_g1~~TRINITY_DN2778_c0_g1_i1.p1  ORF type:complete len:113 (+),score=23.90 TRINITY_DN2778_c0_g1_i1:31-369(+)